MAKTFHFEIVTPSSELIKAEVTEVVLPAYDGEVGVLADHENFIGLLGTGAVKVVKNGQDHWFAISRGVYEVRDGALSLFAQLAEDASSIDAGEAQDVVTRLQALFAEPERLSKEEYEEQKLRYEQNAARLEVSRRMSLN